MIIGVVLAHSFSQILMAEWRLTGANTHREIRVNSTYHRFLVHQPSKNHLFHKAQLCGSMYAAFCAFGYAIPALNIVEVRDLASSVV